jgi:hypothetical protein
LYYFSADPELFFDLPELESLLADLLLADSLLLSVLEELSDFEELSEEDLSAFAPFW